MSVVLLVLVEMRRSDEVLLVWTFALKEVRWIWMWDVVEWGYGSQWSEEYSDT